MLKLNKRLSLLLTSLMVITLVAPAMAHEKKKKKEFVHGIIIPLDHDRYYFNGPADGVNGERDIPGHEWVKLRHNQYIAKHYNTGPVGAQAQWWSSDAEDGSLLWTMHAIIDTWSEVNAVKYYNRGFVHYHPLVSVRNGTPHKRKVAWLKHVATKNFTFDGVPIPPEFAYEVKPGVDYGIDPNWNIPYDPNTVEVL